MEFSNSLVIKWCNDSGAWYKDIRIVYVFSVPWEVSLQETKTKQWKTCRQRHQFYTLKF